MAYNPQIHHRRSIRIPGYDYSRAGLYFVTICCQDRECLFGSITHGRIQLNDAGKMIEKIYRKLSQYHSNIQSGEYVIMPNHFHCIIKLVGADSISAPLEFNAVRNGANMEFARMAEKPYGANDGADSISAPTDDVEKTTLSDVIQTFKRYTTIEYIKMAKENRLPAFNKRIWQRNYYEHIIRNEKSCLRILEYIKNNPVNWQEDDYFVSEVNQ